MRSQAYRYLPSKFIANKNLPLSIRRIHNLRQADIPTLSTESSLQLRDYQKNCIENCLNALDRGVTRIGVSMPTGSGKTTVFVSLLHKIPVNETRPGAKNTLIIVNSIELAIQAANQVKHMFPETTVEIEQGKNTASGLADVTVATFQTLARGDRLYKFPAARTKAVIVDEAHHAAAKSYLSILSHFDPKIAEEQNSEQIESSNIPIIGFSATFGRHDGRALGRIFQEIVHHQDFLQMIKDQWLCNVRFTTVNANIDLSTVAIGQGNGDFVAASLAQVMNTDAINSVVVQSWIDKAGTRKSTLVFCANLAHVHDLTNEFRKRGVDARYIYSGTPIKERKRLLDDFRAGAFQVLINCAILTEGADVPNIDCVVVARPTRSRNVFAQMIGRGMRLSPSTGKEDCHILDFVDAQGRVAGTFSTPSLFGLDPQEMTPGATLDELLEKKEKGATEDAVSRAQGTPTVHNVPDVTSVTYRDYDDPLSWQYQANKERHIFQISSLAWVHSHGSYILECMGRGTIKVAPLNEADGKKNWEVNYIAPWDAASMKALVGRPHRAGRTRRVALAANLADAVTAADSFAKQKLVPGNLGLGLLRNAAWRRAPSTRPQQDILSKTLGISMEPGSTHVTPEKAPIRAWCRVPDKTALLNLTKGTAADLITRMRSGAKGAYDKELQKRARETKVAEKETARRARETVQVGPLRT